MAAIDRVQAEARARWDAAGRKGSILGATGIGKSRIALNRVKELYEEYGDTLAVLLLVPTEKLRDENWPEDAKKWGLEEAYKCVDGVCYVSAPKVEKQHYHLVILDEAHHHTERSEEVFQNITYDELLVLTATRPTDADKSSLLFKRAPIVFEYPVEEAIKDGVVSPFDVAILKIKLDATSKYIRAGSKKKVFYTTEAKQYKFLEENLASLRIRMSKLQNEMAVESLFPGASITVPIMEKEYKTLEARYRIATSKRAQFIYNLRSKTDRAKKMLQSILQDDPSKPAPRVIVFNGSISQSKDVCGTWVYNSKSTDEFLTKFKAEEINYLGVVNAVDEGHNIPNLDYALMVQISSVDRRLIQRIGRVIRFKEGARPLVIIIVAAGTVDEKWAQSALEGIDPSRIKYYEET